MNKCRFTTIVDGNPIYAPVDVYHVTKIIPFLQRQHPERSAARRAARNENTQKSEPYTIVQETSGIAEIDVSLPAMLSIFC